MIFRINYVLFFVCATLGTCIAEDSIDELPIKPFYQLPDYENNIFPRIVGGRQARQNDFPHQVSLQLRNRHICGGAIIDDLHILTAAHCLYDGVRAFSSALMRILAGDIWLQSNHALRQIIPISNIYIHERYNSRTLKNDIGIVRLRRRLVFSSGGTIRNVSPAALQTFPVHASTACSVSGWGLPHENASAISPVLLFVDIYIQNHHHCNQAYMGLIRDTMICAGYPQGYRDSCQGDSGGGLICNGALTGIVSFGNGCGRPGFPGVYTEVRSYSRWIQITMARTDIGNRPSDGPLNSNRGPTQMAASFLLIFLIMAVSYCK